ncbi:hypothetical protein BJV85_000195 [Clostridium acetobutylicum]|uniref:Uncharacterized protein n=1 Tax=Clostridium acetobutylicum (strain ATCC 824 / DSM 792 / JCM 1419 / IAM 19013 / LMG 5710 / NBRC 13948 / NRRL B-527 / VKM B-1787 / 2291 / W) TaxID=272562 RepID=Q97CY5_CLOAB|nr:MULTISPECIES: hypothetical protein [Clostridium]AAK81625.1 Hypothetical protein, CF-37 family(almost identical) [Clostridium acetobutylicum ATCC 824]ADZ22749.1 conserved hypothetical protein [Clostridium acetobutylicum EA 2018]AEI33004.1 hypothetical protein SMB_G3748 [Clostridium acetobutylicum DSM 1731]AWV80700.1 hypothetical protein DK921_11435 [Clostridium acetobutylicum]KHD33891.1 hypothetical protein NL50_18115 [Clostridium acetobutylicum]
MGNEVSVNTNKHKTQVMKVGKIASKVAGVRNGLDNKYDHLKVDKIHTIFKIYDDLTKLVSSYGEMAAHDLKEFRQLGVNIENTDNQGAKR